MIEGLKFDVNCDELRRHLGEKAKHHQERRDFYKEKAAALQSGGAEPAQFTGGDPVQALNSKADNHEHRRTFFQFLREHLVPNETYRLSNEDLLTLEFVSRGGHW